MTYSHIEAKARELFEKHKKEIPVPVVEIAQSLGLTIHDTEMPESDGVTPSGALTPFKDRWIILINEQDSYMRKRFTIAHEIGHFLLHSNQEFIDIFPAGETFYRDGEDSKLEKEANYFAANLLMPENELRTLWPRFSDPSEAAEYFKVSEVSMTFRLKNLQLIV